MRFHPQGPLAGWLFARGVSVDPKHRRRWLGSLVNGSLFLASHDEFDLDMAVETAKVVNAVSVGMIERGGIKLDPDHVSIAVNTSGGNVTR
jgi:hypothetical protein